MSIISLTEFDSLPTGITDLISGCGSCAFRPRSVKICDAHADQIVMAAT